MEVIDLAAERAVRSGPPPSCEELVAIRLGLTFAQARASTRKRIAQQKRWLASSEAKLRDRYLRGPRRGQPLDARDRSHTERYAARLREWIAETEERLRPRERRP